MEGRTSVLIHQVDIRGRPLGTFFGIPGFAAEDGDDVDRVELFGLFFLPGLDEGVVEGGSEVFVHGVDVGAWEFK
jgi:hypothetical protein